MDSHKERRRNESDRRHEDSGLFPIQDHEGKWVVTDRRETRRRIADMSGSLGMWGGLKTVSAISAFLVLIILWMMVRYGVIHSPGWMPSWLIYPEILFRHLKGS